MTYFEILEIEPTFVIDETKLKINFLKLSRRYHPDRYVLESKALQSEAEEKTAVINKAYNILLNKDTRLKYLLELHHVLKPEEIYTLDQNFLMDMMDINDMIMSNALEAEKELNTKESILEDEIKPILNSYRFIDVTPHDLTQIKEYYYKKRYLWRLRENLKGNIGI